MCLDTRKYTHDIQEDRPIGTSATELHEHVLMRDPGTGMGRTATRETR